MVRLLARMVLAIFANAVGLIAASLLLDGFKLNASGFFTAVLIFSVCTLILGPFMVSVALRNIPALMGGIALVTTLVSLIITDIISKGLNISGASAWVIGTLIVWLCSLLASVVLPLVLFKNILGHDKKEKVASDNQT